MKLAQLFSLYPHPKWGDTADKDVRKIVVDSRLVEEGDVFIATRGRQFDSHTALLDVSEKGAIGLVVEDASFVPDEFAGAVLEVGSCRNAVGLIANHFYQKPSEKIFSVGITGTNGKSTTAYMVEAILRGFDWSLGVIGTIDHHIGDKVWDEELTTPPASVLHSRLADFVALKAKAAVLEVSNVALDQQRVKAVSFDAAIFTNLTRDHLDYHSDMNEYFRCKEKLFNEVLDESKKEQTYAIINRDDFYGKNLKVNAAAKLWYYGQSEDCDLRLQVLEQSFLGIRARIDTPRGGGELRLPMAGEHNAYNAVAAIGVGLAAGMSIEKCIEALESFRGVPGRLEMVPNEKGIHVFVDYAHTSDALENVLKSLSQVREKVDSSSKILTVFGCGGDRDKGKRPLMAKAAEKYSDKIIVTSDNPRTEDANEILHDIETGFTDNQYVLQVDREKAIHQALEMANKGDVVLIAGKGHETYQIIGSEKMDFNDYHVVQEFLSC